MLGGTTGGNVAIDLQIADPNGNVRVGRPGGVR
jgi:hypothetical protein